MDWPQERADQARLESERLDEYLQTLPAEALEQQSACEQWTVGDVVAQLIGGAQMCAEHITRGVQGNIAPPDGFPPAGEGDPEVMGQLNAHRTIFRRAGIGNQLLPVFRSANDRLNQLIAGLRPDDWDKPCYHPIGVIPVQTFVSLRMFELSLHGWDIASKLEPDPHLSTESLPALIELISTMCSTLVQAPPGYPPGDRYRFRLDGAATGDYDIVMESTGARMAKAGAEPADAVLRCDSEHFPLLMTGRVSVESAMNLGHLVIEDGRWLPPGFGDWFKGVWRPGSG